MKRYGDLFNKIVNMENLKLAHKNARKGKTSYKWVKIIDENPEPYLKIVQKKLMDKTYFTSRYREFIICDRGKSRNICDLPYFPDRIVHWALMQVIEPILLKNLIDTTYAALPNRGAHLALRTMQSYMKDDHEGTMYCLKLDIAKFFPHIDKEILKSLFRRKIKCKETLWLLDEIIDSYSEGIPIGNYTSQYFGNFYLSCLDHWLKENSHTFNVIVDGVCTLDSRKVSYYLRYMDDMIIFSDSKEFLHQLRKDIDVYLQTFLNLKLKSNWQVFPTYIRGVDFVGYRTFEHYTLLRNGTKKRLKKATKFLRRKLLDGIPLSYSNNCTLCSYEGILMWCDSFRLRQSTIQMVKNAV